jgi:hypothetical protein
MGIGYWARVKIPYYPISLYAMPYALDLISAIAQPWAVQTCEWYRQTVLFETGWR